RGPGRTAVRPYVVVHTDGGFSRDWSIETERLAAMGARFVPTVATTEEELVANTREADALCVTSARISRRVIENLERCRVIVRYGVGFDVVDVEAATERGIMVCTMPDFCTEEVANHALLLLLACNRRLVMLHDRMRDGVWGRPELRAIGPLYGETLGVIGYGRIGRAMARRARALGMRVIAADPYTTEPPEADDRILPLDAVLAEADYVSIHTPLTAETRGLFDERTLRLMRRHAYLINTARGPVIDQAALLRALTEGWIAGAGLDVFESEPITVENPLLRLANVVLTPHSAFYSEASVQRQHEKAAENVIAALMGARPPGLLNDGVWSAAGTPSPGPSPTA
ncbi:MAG: C-terminal binding protein, partial [Dehalococcoidia bacterium]